MAESALSEFLGRGLGFPLGVDASGALAAAAYEDSVRQSIWIILSTAPGERPMRPDFGCGINELVFAPNTPLTAQRVDSAVRDALLRFEPRIDLRALGVQAEGGGERLTINIEYQVIETQNVFNLVYPFYLQDGAA